MKLHRDLALIYAAAFLRATGVGLTGVVLGIYLAHQGFSPARIGAVIAAGMAGVALGTIFASFHADRLGRRRALVLFSLLATVGGVGLAYAVRFPHLLLLAFLGMLNGMGTDRGAAYSLEHAMVPQAVPAERRTWALAWYNLLGDAGHALGALAGALPYLFRRWLDLDLLASFELTFLIYAALNLLSAGFYLWLGREVELEQAPVETAARGASVSPESSRIVLRLAALFGLDGLGGGFLTDALIAYWFFRRFGVSEASLGLLFFTVHLLNAGSYLVAAWLARRIGLLNTMVFTHIPSSLFLMAVAFAPSYFWAVILFLAREALVEMDVPTRQSYLLAVVAPESRTFATGMTSLARNLAWASSPSLAGYLMAHLAAAAPLFVGGGIKIVYDLLLYAAFRRTKPPEEQAVEV